MIQKSKITMRNSLLLGWGKC